MRPTIAEFWFDEELPSQGVDIAVLRQFTRSDWSRLGKPFHTLVIDLNDENEALLSRMKPDTRNAIRRGIAKDGVITEAWGNPSPEQIGEFFDFHQKFLQQKRLPSISRIQLDQLASAGSLHLTRATTQALGTTSGVWHSYVVRNQRARLLHSSSLFRESDSQTRNLVGRANRTLHWADILYFRQFGCRIYDFGGWYEGKEDTAKLAINHFKEDFGGKHVEGYNATVPLTWLGSLYLRVKGLRGSRHERA